MAISDPYSISFCNNQVRPTGDQIAQLYFQCKAVFNTWTANNLVAQIGVASGTVLDNAAVLGDGRRVITGNDVNNFINRCGEMINWMERGTLNASGVLNNSFLNTILVVAVNP